ncbi:hypothetical protein KIPB_005824 [Kipferlia bialata]|uniref:Lipid-binding serum glycoprotein C-terminal domain-containing protein n=1 Tax=Kipferlia bialata TaxID=797122 RepID=A0A9K3CXS2_9EUKA|nr:hypothetical protein KIPB_005824 [Kipferlia bialata]|eukprot:g5824.t1
MWVVVALALCICMALAGVPPSGFLTSINQRALQKIEDAFLPLLEAELTHIDVPDIQLKDPFTIDFTEIDITVTSWGSLNVSFNDDGGIHVFFTGFSLVGWMKWHYKDWVLVSYVQDSGTATLGCEDSTIGFHLDLTDTFGELTMRVSHMHSDIGYISVDTHGSWAQWIYDDIIKVAEPSLNKSVQDALNSGIPDAVDGIASGVLSEINWLAPIDNHEYTDDPFSLVELPSVIPSVFGHDGSAYDIDIVVTEDVPNSMVAVAVQRGQLNFNITSEDLGGFLEIRNLSMFMPCLRDLFPDDQMAPFYLYLEPVGVPKVHFDTDTGITVDASGCLSALYSDGYEEYDLFGMDIDLSLSARPEIFSNSTDVYVLATLGVESMDITKTHFLCDMIDFQGIEDLVNSLFMDLIVPVWNGLFEEYGGIPLPMLPGVELVDPAFLYGRRMLQIGTDFAISV